MSESFPAPVLETDRLILRLPAAADFEEWADFMADPEATRFLGGVQSRAVAWRGMAALVGAWRLRGYSFFSVIDRETGRWAGRVGPWYPEGWPGPEIGWGIAPRFQRRGYAVEASAAAMDFAFDSLGWTEVIHCIDRENLASAAVARRLGSRLLRRDVRIPPFENPADIWGQTREEWRKRSETGLREDPVPGP